MPSKRKKFDGRQGRELTDTIAEVSTLQAKAFGLDLKPTEVWLGPRERAGLLAVILEKAQVDRHPDLVNAVLRGDPEGTTLMGLTVRSMTKPGVRVGFTIGEPPAERAKSSHGRRPTRNPTR